MSSALFFQHILCILKCTYLISLPSLHGHSFSKNSFQKLLLTTLHLISIWCPSPSSISIHHISTAPLFSFSLPFPSNWSIQLEIPNYINYSLSPNSTPSTISLFTPFSTNKSRSNRFQIGIHKHLHHLFHLFHYYQLFLNIKLTKLSIPFSGISPYALSCWASSGVYFMIISALSSWKSRSPISTISPTPIHTFESNPRWIHYLLSHFSTDIAKSSFSIKAVAFHAAISKHLINSSIF